MNAPDTEGASFASRFWQSTKRLFNSTIWWFSCRAEEDRSDPGQSKPKKISKSTKTIEIPQPRKSIRGLDGLKVIKSHPLAYKSNLNLKRLGVAVVKSVPDRVQTKDTSSKIIESIKSIEVKSIPKPDSTEVRKIIRSNSNRSIGLVLSARKKSSAKIGSDGRIQAPGVPAISRAPDGRVIRLTFMTGFPKKKSPEAQRIEPDDLLMAKRLRASKEVHQENGSTDSDVIGFDLDSKDTITKDEIRGTSPRIKSLVMAGMKEDRNSVSQDVIYEDLAIGRKSAQSIDSAKSLEIDRKNGHH